MAKSPVAIPFSTDGVEIAVKDGTALPTNARGNIAAGLDSAGNTQFLSMGTDGHAQVLARAQTATGGTITVTGTGSTQAISGHEGHQMLVFSSSGTWAGAVFFQASVDNVNWSTLPIVLPLTLGGQPYAGLPFNSSFQVPLVGMPYLRLFVSSWTSGTLTIAYAFSSAVTQTPAVAQGYPSSLANRWPVRVTDGTNSLPTMDVAARSGFMRVTDATNTAAVKAASTAAVAADSALVVGIHPTSNTTRSYQDTGTVVFSADGTQNLTVTGFSTLALEITGTYVGTIQVKGNVDSTGSPLNDLYGYDTTNLVMRYQLTTGFTSRWVFDVSDLTIVQIAMTGYVSGSCNVAYSLNAGSTATAGNTLTDGRNVVAVKAASTAAAASDPALVVALSPNSPVQATIKPHYAASSTDMTITLASLASSVTAARASAVVSNASDLYEDVLFFVKYQTIASASATGYVNIYGYASIDGGTTYSGGATGSDAALTLTNPTPLVLLVSLPASASSTQYNAGPFSFCRLYGIDRLPERWGFVVANVSGQALSATAANNKIFWQGVRGKLA